MPTRPSPLLRRAIEIFEERERITREELIGELWPLVQPGIAYRHRERQVTRSRELRTRENTAARLDHYPDSYKIEMGTRAVVRMHLSSWIRNGVVTENGDGRLILLRLPVGL